MINHRLNSTTTALTQKRLAVIALAAERIAYSNTGGKVAQIGTTKAVELTLSRQHQMVINGK